MIQSTSLQQFSREGWNLRTIEQDGNVLFCGTDVEKALGYAKPNNALNAHCKGAPIQGPLETAGGIQQVRFITEGDVYRLIASSKLPSAQRFERWVFDEVLPRIRRTGGYIPTDAQDDEKTILAKALLIMQRTAGEQAKTIERQTSELESRHFQTIDRRMTRDMVYGLLRGAGYVEARSNKPTKKAIEPGYLVQCRFVRDDRRLGRAYARFTTKGANWFIRRFIYGDNQGRLELEGVD